ncbi:MAG: bifunctional diaminohydroxyphosphoribosylaminopyrimidine deaminase/5-amino-6-(5-phosphoribosylamino)uracil reductase RibD [Candidatus Methylacidiphilales bacterium]|nr:bifunctional diaminohydroxyphosphoribosylaminopyrimidine deaminase/5-amino-6-(5-phosphoribosylamino)uracil reductase RibD [Candidatus Methylacidiphilales bacterium]
MKPVSDHVDAAYMECALTLAARGLGRTSPNPCVGAVLVRGRKILGQGWHRRAGSAHAEVLALRQAVRRGHSTRGATLYVTLEPCCTHGRTPPCTGAILAAGIQRVVVAATDPNPAHAGRAYRILRKAGVTVTTGVLARQSAALNRSFNHWITTGRPWVVGKAAFSLDGKMTRPDGKQWLTSATARRDAHRLRATCDAILIGAGTARHDDPRLNVRDSRLPSGRLQPWRVIVTRSGRLPRHLHLITDAQKDRTLIYRHQSWSRVLKDLGKRGVTRLLVEGGGEVLDDLARKGLIQESIHYYAPFHFHNNRKLVSADRFRALPLQNTRLTTLGPDLKLEGIVASFKT